MNATPNNPIPGQPRLRRADGTVFPLKPGCTVIGRDPSCDLRLDDPSVSKRHCTIALSERGVSVTDLGSTNRSFVNQSCLREGQSTQLLHGDRLILGRSILTFFDPQSAAAESAELESIETPASGRSPSESTVVSFDLDGPF